MKKALVEGLHFHDLRALAATRMSKKLNQLQLAKVLGLRILVETGHGFHSKLDTDSI